jgi:hypothetical protein
MTGMPVARRQPDARPPRTAARRPGMVWGALLLFAFFGLGNAFLSALVFATIRDDQVHGPSVPAGLWLFFVVLIASAVLNVVLGVFIFRAARWAWITAVVLVGLSIVAILAATVLSGSGVSLTGLVPDIATIGVLLNRNVRGWCFGWPVVMDRDGREWYAPGPRQGPGIFGS